MRRTIVATLIGGTAFLLSFSAAANGRFPLSNQIVFSTTNSNLIVTRTSYGILVSRDNGGSWSLICEDAIGITPSTLADPPVGLTQNDSLLVGVQQGLNVSSDVGCNWNCAGGAGLVGNPIADLAVRPDNPSSAVAMTLSYPPTDSGLVLTNSQVFETTNNGAAWVALGDAGLDPTIVATTVDVAKTDPQRLYVSATRGFGLTQTASLFVSKDKGQTWTEYPLPKSQFDPSMEFAVYIGAVDPTNADRLYLRSRGQPTGGESRLTAVTLSATGGAPTFTTVRIFDVEAGFSGLQGELLGLALSSDGSKIYIGTKEDGLWMAQTSNLSFQKQSSVIVQCLATRGSELWACSAAVSGFIVGVSTNDGKTFTSKLPLIGDLAGPIACKASANGSACDEDANSSQCPGPFELFCSTYGCGPPTDGSPGDDASPGGSMATASGSRSGGTSPSSSSSCNCNLALVRGGGAAALGAGFALACVALRRRRRQK